MRGDGRVFRPKNCTSWYIAYMAPRNGQKVEVRERAGATEKEAKDLLKKRRDELGSHRQGLRKFQGPKQEKITVAQLLDALQRDAEIKGLASLDTIRIRIARLKIYFGTTRALDVTTDSVREYIRSRQDEKAAPATINRELEPLGQAYRLALKDGRLSLAPRMPDPLPENNTRAQIFTVDEVETVLARLAEVDADAHDFYAWLFRSGMRPKAIAALEWTAFDREEWVLSLPAKDDKNKYARPIPLTGELRAIIERRMKARPSPSCLSIFHRRGNRIDPNKLRDRVFYPVCRELGIATGRAAGKIPYDLKRTGLRTMRRAGVPEERAMQFSGHRTTSTFRRYAITDLDDLRGDVQRVDAYLAALPKSPETTDTVRTSKIVEFGKTLGKKSVAGS